MTPDFKKKAEELLKAVDIAVADSYEKGVRLIESALREVRAEAFEEAAEIVETTPRKGETYRELMEETEVELLRRIANKLHAKAGEVKEP